ncbi:MAG: hypothetical protein ACR2LL_12740 [Nitrosopumilus sp.]
MINSVSDTWSSAQKLAVLLIQEGMTASCALTAKEKVTAAPIRKIDANRILLLASILYLDSEIFMTYDNLKSSLRE